MEQNISQANQLQSRYYSNYGKSLHTYGDSTYIHIMTLLY